MGILFFIWFSMFTLLMHCLPICSFQNKNQINHLLKFFEDPKTLLANPWGSKDPSLRTCALKQD